MVRLQTTIKANVLSALIIMSGLTVGNAQDDAPNLKIWTQTSVEDFSKGTLQDVVITNTSGGELRLRHPIKKVVADH